ncbi:lipocalin family protein [Candidatus Methylopumilus turicensis]|uniref:Outer membrane lipoprotein Blc n=1 Tax=Candidatus Methylopumilus turicensis TaxID=1581680 RepID=A0A0B7IX96_9PROT|nr:lipocalin family protein [Candidatus Methylopumilus turicensis]CEN55703.1 outer membrane lipoprotein (lipocalin) [Candidatus Methylopumilus turicensis]
MLRKLVLIAMLLLISCTGDDAKYKAVTGFEVDKYLGTWYEIARLDHSFERGLDKVYAEYSLREDGGLKVINHGFDTKKQKWNEAIGKAYFVETPDIGRLKVSFFGPFYGAYTIVELDKTSYSYALVTGGDDYLWILSRTPQMSYIVKQQLIAKAKALGFATDKLIYPNQ